MYSRPAAEASPERGSLHGLARDPGLRGLAGFADRLARNFTAQDVLMLLFHGVMYLRVWLAPDSVTARLARVQYVWILVPMLLAIALARGELLPPGRLRAVFYRLATTLPIIASYAVLRVVLPALLPASGVITGPASFEAERLWDPGLLRFDELLLGQTPAQFLDRFVTPQTVEWFAFFYWSYYLLVFSHVFAVSLLDRGRRQYELLCGTMLICGLGHTLYTVVPGVGPYATMKFSHVLTGGRFWGMVQHTVTSAGALLDIFPSLHTAYPTFLTLHSLRHRHSRPFRYTWPVTAFFTANIVIATLFLRWHYFVDVLAGVALAATVQRMVVWLAAYEVPRRDARAQPIWEALGLGGRLSGSEVAAPPAESSSRATG